MFYFTDRPRGQAGHAEELVAAPVASFKLLDLDQLREFDGLLLQNGGQQVRPGQGGGAGVGVLGTNHRGGQVATVAGELLLGGVLGQGDPR